MRLNLFAPKKRFDAFEIAPKPTLFDGKANTAEGSMSPNCILKYISSADTKLSDCRCIADALEFGQNTVWRLCALFS
jgi:hypothetical protein